MSSPGDGSDVSVRPATRADLPAIVRLLANDPLGRYREDPVEPLPRSYEQAFEEIDRDPRHELVVLEGRDGVIGTLQLSILTNLSYQGGRRAQIEAVRIDYRLRGQGMGERLLEWAIDRARQHDCCLVQLTTDARRPDARRFYERLGFEASHTGLKLQLR
jgi:GNAT superfamily N-acetyltransferase